MIPWVWLQVTPTAAPNGVGDVKVGVDDLERGLKELEQGEKWALMPKKLENNPGLWTPGIKWNVQPGSFTHMTELFGPVLGVMKVNSMEDALALVALLLLPACAGIERTASWANPLAVPGKALSDDYARKMRHAYLAAISYVDAQIGKLLSAHTSNPRRACCRLRAAQNRCTVFWLLLYSVSQLLSPSNNIIKPHNLPKLTQFFSIGLV